jgi:molecular chaperone GrpE
MAEQQPIDETVDASAGVADDALTSGQEGTDPEAAEQAEPSSDQRLQALADEANAAKDQALRAQAELDNYRKRTQRELAEERKYAALAVVRDLLPGLDNLQRAIDAGQNVEDLSAMLQGVEMVAGQFREILAKHGTTAIDAVGQPFDPNRHEAIQQMPSAEHPPMTVIDEVERGYQLHDRVVRPSKVIVSVAPPEQ